MSATKASYLKLEVNQPMVGNVKYLAHYAERENPTKPGTTFAAQWVLTGQWRWTDAESGQEQTADGKVSIDVFQLATSPVTLGLGKQDGTWDDGNPKYKWTHQGPIRLVKTKDGKKVHVAIQRLDSNGQPIAAPTAAGAESRPPAASPSKGSAIPVSATAVPASVPPTDDAWTDLARQYQKAAGIASWVWGASIAPEHMVAAAATVFIEANKRGLTVPAPVEKLTPEQKAERIRESFDKFAEKPEALKDEADDDLPF